MVKTTGKLTRLDNITLFEKLPPTKFYSIDQYYIDKADIGVAGAVDSSVNDRDLNLELYIALLIFTNRASVAKDICT
ncbi:hypothetical protein [Candidatus Cardinium hertigii]|uniref:hypothetical protein n=1 Tax=Candidatus Cardinium hertigii TaxID=247481 RepID=UPI000D706209|nr:hypothetical protein [Candidatus Cardinium hertigii]